MPMVFPPPIYRLPEADIPFRGARAFLSQSARHQVLFMEFGEDVEVPEHAHEAQWAVVVDGRIDLTIDGVRRTHGRGDRYFIPAGVVHSAHIHAGYADVTFFDQADRYRAKAVPPGGHATG